MVILVIYALFTNNYVLNESDIAVDKLIDFEYFLNNKMTEK